MRTWAMQSDWKSPRHHGYSHHHDTQEIFVREGLENRNELEATLKQLRIGFF